MSFFVGRISIFLFLCNALSFSLFRVAVRVRTLDASVWVPAAETHPLPGRFALDHRVPPTIGTDTEKVTGVPSELFFGDLYRNLGLS